VPNYGKSVNIRQTEIQQHQVGLVTARVKLRALPIFGLYDDISAASERRAQNIANRWVILNDQNSMRGVSHGLIRRCAEHGPI
jgi:hypothetical protein